MCSLQVKERMYVYMIGTQILIYTKNVGKRSRKKKSSIQINRHISLGCQFEDEKANSINIF